MYDVRLVMPIVIPTSSSSHFRMLFMLCPPARAASISGQRALIWPALVMGFSSRLCARRERATMLQPADFPVSCDLCKKASTYNSSGSDFWTTFFRLFFLSAFSARWSSGFYESRFRRIASVCDRSRQFSGVTAIRDEARRFATNRLAQTRQKGSKRPGSGT